MEEKGTNVAVIIIIYIWLAGWLALINLDYFLIEIMIVSNRPGRYQDQGDGAAQTLADTRKLHQDK